MPPGPACCPNTSGGTAGPAAAAGGAGPALRLLPPRASGSKVMPLGRPPPLLLPAAPPLPLGPVAAAFPLPRGSNAEGAAALAPPTLTLLLGVSCRAGV